MKKAKPTFKQMSFIEKLRPLNLEEEKRKFLFDQNYNPQFEYSIAISPHDLLRYGEVSDEYIEVTKQILDTVIKTYETQTAFLQQERGRVLTKDEAIRVINDFLRLNRLEKFVRLSFSSSYSARTSLKKTGSSFVLQIRTPVEYRERSLQGVLYHEIGTHLFRWLNEMEQPWFQKRNEYGLGRSYLITEEGLAGINSLLGQPAPYLWSQALNYYAVYEGSQSSFAELNKKLKQYVVDPERRWNYCLKVKRGIADTSTHNVFTRNQIYFLGVIQVLRWLITHDFQVEQLYLGKIALADIEMAMSKATHSPVLPDFLHSRQNYVDQINKIISLNQLESIL